MPIYGLNIIFILKMFKGRSRAKTTNFFLVSPGFYHWGKLLHQSNIVLISKSLEFIRIDHGWDGGVTLSGKTDMIWL